MTRRIIGDYMGFRIDDILKFGKAISSIQAGCRRHLDVLENWEFETSNRSFLIKHVSTKEYEIVLSFAEICQFTLNEFISTFKLDLSDNYEYKRYVDYLEKINDDEVPRIIDFQNYFECVRRLFEVFQNELFYHEKSILRILKRAPPELNDCISEINNNLVLRQYRITLVIIGREIESLFRIALKKIKPRHIIIKSGTGKVNTKKIERLTFYECNLTLYKKKFISDRIRKEIEPLIKYRNMGAHPISLEELTEIEEKQIFHIGTGISNLIKLFHDVEELKQSKGYSKVIDISREMKDHISVLEEMYF